MLENDAASADERARLRLFVLRVLVLSMLVTLLGRLAWLQLVAADELAAEAAANRTRDVITPAARGEIVDVTGAPLVRNRTALVVSVHRSLLRQQPDRGDAVLERLGSLLGRSPAELAAEITPCGPEVPEPCWSGSPYQPVPVAEFSPDDAAGVQRVLAVEEHSEDFRGVSAQLRAVRDYPTASAAHVLGYLGPVTEDELATDEFADARPNTLVGRAGVEASYDDRLRGRDGVRTLLVDRVGTVVGEAGERLPQPGETLVLSLHAGVQAVAEQALQRAMERARTIPARGTGEPLRADSGAVVVMDVQTGRLVALASAPSYDPSLFVGGISTQDYAALVDESRAAPLVSRPVQGAFAPASTFKVVSTAAAVQSGDYPLTGRYPCPGSYAPLGGKRNFDGVSFGSIDLHTALVVSCDTVFYKFAYEQWLRDGGNAPVAEPRDPILTMAKAFGLGAPTGVDLPGERSGLVPDREFLQRRWEQRKDDYCAGAQNPAFPAQRRQADQEFCDEGWRFRAGDAANLAIGQGDLLVTPLQLATVYAALANGGRLVTPTVARALVAPDGTVSEVSSHDRGTVPVAPDVLAYIRNALAEATTRGTAAAAFSGLPLPVAGKTGTGEVAGKQDTSWFASYAPADDPRLVVIGVVTQGGTGSTVAAPMVREVYEGIWGLGGRSAALPDGRLPDAVPELP